MKDTILELHKQHQASQERYTYFLLAASGACIAYTTERAFGMPLNISLIVAGLSVVAWALSFYCGCKCANLVQSLIRANTELLYLKLGSHESQPQTPELLTVAIREVRSGIDTNMSRASFYNNWQFRMFVVAGVLFVFWRVVEIIRVAPSATLN